MIMVVKYHSKDMVGTPKTPVKADLGMYLCIVRTFCVLFVIKLELVRLRLVSYFCMNFMLLNIYCLQLRHLPDFSGRLEGSNSSAGIQRKKSDANGLHICSSLIKIKPAGSLIIYLFIAILNYLLIARTKEGQQFPSKTLRQGTLPKI